MLGPDVGDVRFGYVLKETRNLSRTLLECQKASQPFSFSQLVVQTARAPRASLGRSMHEVKEKVGRNMDSLTKDVSLCIPLCGRVLRAGLAMEGECSDLCSRREHGHRHGMVWSHRQSMAWS